MIKYTVEPPCCWDSIKCPDYRGVLISERFQCIIIIITVEPL